MGSLTRATVDGATGSFNRATSKVPSWVQSRTNSVPEPPASYGLEILKRTHFPVSPRDEASDKGEL